MRVDNPVLISFKNLRKSFGGQTVLDGVSGELRKGEVVLLRGENGSGETTLLNILTGCLEPDAGTIRINSPQSSAEETYRFPRPWYRRLTQFRRFTPEQAARLGVGRTWQDVRLFGSLDLADNIAAASPDQSDSPWRALFTPSRTKDRNRLNRQSAADVLAELGLQNHETSSADKISLGQSKRVAIARALHARARVIFLDEPLSALDCEGCRDVISHLRALASSRDFALVIVEHVLNIPQLGELVTKVWTLHDGAIREDRSHVIWSGLGAPRDKNIGTLICQSLELGEPDDSQRLPGGASLTHYRQSPPASGPSDPSFFEVDKLVLKRGGRRLFGSDGDLSLKLSKRSVSVLEAPNGWGKSSLLDHITGFLAQESGRVTLNGTSLGRVLAAPLFYRVGGRALRSDIMLFPSLTVSEIASLAKVKAPVEQANHIAGTLSGGQNRILGINCLDTPELLLLDEFLRGLDLKNSGELLRRILSNSETTVLFLQPATAPI